MKGWGLTRVLYFRRRRTLLQGRAPWFAARGSRALRFMAHAAPGANSASGAPQPPAPSAAPTPTRQHAAGARKVGSQGVPARSDAKARDAAKGSTAGGAGARAAGSAPRLRRTPPEERRLKTNAPGSSNPKPEDAVEVKREDNGAANEAIPHHNL